MRKLACLLAVIGLSLLGTGVAFGAPGDGGPPFRNGEVVVKGSPADFPGFTAVKYLPHADLTVLKVDSGQEWGQVQRFRQHGKRAGLNFIAQAFEVPNDPLYSPYQWHLTKIQAEAAWNITTGAGAVVAVVDTGLVPTANDPDLDGIGCVVAGYNAVTNGATSPYDGDGHGTHVSGTVAQTTNNSTGVAGMAHGACVMPVKVLGDDGSGSFADIAEGIRWAVDIGKADVINMSLGLSARAGVTNDPIVDPELDHAYEAGVTVVVAAGNDGWRKNVSYPAIYPTVIAVGATGYDNTRVSYSNYGTGLDIMAPGGNTAVDQNGDGYYDGVLQETYIASSGGWGYYFFQGTSMASPHVAAVAAMLYAQNPSITPAQVYDRLTSTALDLGAAGYDSVYGYGLVQAADALGGGGGCTDCDDDGYTVDEGDCDDTNPNVNPGELEDCGDLIDNNCAGGINEGCLPTCDPAGTPCTSNVDCCSLLCHPRKLTCK